MSEKQKLFEISENIWHTDSTLKWYFLTFGIRMVVVKLPTGGLWLHSPIQIDDVIYEILNTIYV